MLRRTALAYIRKSLVKAGGPEPASPALQRDLIANAAANLGLTPEFFEDASGHSSGHTQDRPGWQACMARLADGDVAALIVHTWDRAARNTKHLLQVADDCEAAGVRFVSVSDNIDTRTSSGRFQLTIIAGVGEYESNAASERRVATIDYLRRAKGRHYGTPPFGTERVARDGDLVLVPSSKTQPNGGTDHDALARAYALYGAGRLSLRNVCVQLNAEGWRWRMRGGELVPWRAEALRRTLANHMLYAGYVSVGRAYRDAGHELLKGSHAPILPETLLAPIAALFRAYTKGRTRRTPLVYPLSGLLYCGGCGQRLVASGPRDWRGYGHTMRCTAGQQGGTSGRRLEKIAQDRLRAALGRAPASVTQQADEGVLDALASQDGASTGAEARQLAAALDNLQELFTWGHIDKATYTQRRAEYLARSAAPTAPAGGAEAAAVLALVPPLDAIDDMAPREFGALLRAFYDRLTLTDGEMAFTPKEWCAEWA